MQSLESPSSRGKWDEKMILKYSSTKKEKTLDNALSKKEQRYKEIQLKYDMERDECISKAEK